MFIVMGATGHVGAAVADSLLSQGEKVTILTRKPESAGAWRAKGAAVAKADAEDSDSLRRAFALGRRAFLLNPPADPKVDTNAVELRTIANILTALDGSGLEKVVAASTYGAQAGDGIGDLSTLWTLEAGLRAQPIPAAVNRGAYYMTNWLGYADLVRQSGALPSLFPAETSIPMVAPDDLGRAAAERLRSPPEGVGVEYVEGPARYTAQDVAKAFALALAREVHVEVVPRDRWVATFKAQGFSDEAAHSYARMSAASLDPGFDKPASPKRGRVTLESFISQALRA